ncbi:unnamed protein product [Diamesa serratosioi]
MSSSATSATSHILQVQMKDSILAGNKNKLWKTDLVVHIRNMSFETIHQSGSFRINGITAENFIESDKSENLRDKLSNYLSDKIEMYKSCLRPTNLNLRVQIFSIVAKDDDNKTLDLRFTATVRDESVDKMLNFVDEIHFILLENQKEIEKQFKFKILAVNINKCRSEENECKSSCYNKITEIKPSNPIITTHHSFYGLNIIMESVCECQPNFDSFNNVMKNQDGPISIKHHCPIIFPNIEPCDNWSLNIFFIPKSHTGMILKFDPAEYELTHVVDDYLMLELVNFEPQLTVDFGSVECYQSYTTPNNIYSDESSFYTEVQYALGSEASPGNNKNYEIMGPNNINTINKNGTYALPKK